MSSPNDRKPSRTKHTGVEYSNKNAINQTLSHKSQNHLPSLSEHLHLLNADSSGAEPTDKKTKAKSYDQAESRRARSRTAEGAVVLADDNAIAENATTKSVASRSGDGTGARSSNSATNGSDDFGLNLQQHSINLSDDMRLASSDLAYVRLPEPELPMLPVDKQLTGCCYFPRRFIVLLMTATAAFLSALFRQILSITVTAIQEREGWLDSDLTLIEDSFVWGYGATCVVGGYLSYRHGFKNTLGIGVVLNALTTMMSPFAMNNLAWFIVCRCASGAAEGVVLPATYTMMSKWAPLTERARFVAVIWCSSFGGAAVGSAWQLFLHDAEEQLGWAIIYVAMGIAGVVWFGLWVVFIAEVPEDNRGMAQRERRFILDSVPRPKPGRSQRHSQRMTWRAWLGVVFNFPVLAIVINHMAFSMSLFVFTSTVPAFLRFYKLYPPLDSSDAWLWTALPLAALAIVAALGAVAADRAVARRAHPTVVRQVAQLSGVLLPTSFLIVLSMADFGPTPVTVMTIVAGSLLGLQVSGWATDVLDVAPAFAGVVMSVTLLAACVPQIGAAFLMPYLVRKFHNWTAALIVASGLNVFAALIWALCSTGRRTDVSSSMKL